MPTGLVYDERCLSHKNGSMLTDERAKKWLDVPHHESPARVARSLEVLQASGVAEHLERLTPREATEDDLMLVHSRDHIEKIRSASDSDVPVEVGLQSRAQRGSWEAALLSAGGALSAIDWTLAEQERHAYVLTRPPGHHASYDKAMGFCLFNNIAIAARHARDRRGLQRVAIVDWDVHHGNGTHDTFYEDGSVLYVSLHQDGLFPPDTGQAEDTGRGEGAGATINIPLQAGTSNRGYLLAFEQVVVPAVRSFQPELILVSAGGDPAGTDPLGMMSVTTEGFRRMMRHVKNVARDVGCPVVALQEGGYSADHLPFCVLPMVEELADLEPQLGADPMQFDVPSPRRDWKVGAVESVTATRQSRAGKTW